LKKEFGFLSHFGRDQSRRPGFGQSQFTLVSAILGKPQPPERSIIVYKGKIETIVSGNDETLVSTG